MSPSPAPTDSSPQRIRRWPAALALVVVGVLALWGGLGLGSDRSGPGPVRSSTPANGEPLAARPTSVSLTFATDVTAGPGGITVVGGNGERVDQGVTTRPAPNQLRVALRPGLDTGSYRVDYRALNRSGEVLAGHLAFGVGAPPDPTVIDRLAPPARPLVGAVSTLATAALLLGALVAMGLAIFTVLVAPKSPAQRHLVPVVRGGVLGAVVGAALLVVGRAGEATGAGLGSVGTPGVLGSVLRQGNTGWWLVGLVIGLGVIYAGIGVGAAPVRQAVVVYGSLVAAGSFALAGHSAVGTSVVGGVGNAVHVGVAAVWLGGVIGLWSLVRQTDPGAADAARRFTPLAVGSMVVLWISGAAQTAVLAGSVTALWSSTWGLVLVAKLLVVMATMAVAVWGQRVVAHAPERLGPTLGAQAALLVVAVAVSSLLVTTIPDPDTGLGPQPSSQTLPVTDNVEVNLLVTPGATGVNDIHITYLDDTGALTDRIESVTVEMSLAFGGIGPIVINGSELEPGHYLISTEKITTPGVWRMDVVSRSGTTELRRVVFEVPIGD